MQTQSFTFSNATVNYYFAASFPALKKLVKQKTTVLITDQNLESLHKKKFKEWNVIVLNKG